MMPLDLRHYRFQREPQSPYVLERYERKHPADWLILAACVVGFVVMLLT